MRLKFVNSEGEELILPTENKFILQEWDGFANFAHSLSTSKAPEQIGATVINRVFDPRTLNIAFW